jgi:hypothetical protein
MNWTLPVGTAGVPVVLLTVTVKVTDCPESDGFKLDINDVEVLSLLTVSVPFA